MSVRLACVGLALLLMPLGIAAQDASPAPEVVDGKSADPDVKPPQVVVGSQRPPEYPPAASAARFTGTVTVQVQVLPDGKVGNVEVVECTRPKVGFEEASVAAVKKWRFKPAMKADEPIEASLKFKLNFNRPGSGKASITGNIQDLGNPPTHMPTDASTRSPRTP